MSQDPPSAGEPAGRVSPPKSTRCVLALNGGSSSLKFGLYRLDSSMTPLASGQIERIGSPESVLKTREPGGSPESQSVAAPDLRSAGGILADWLEKKAGLDSVEAIGHRLVHGGPHYDQPQIITPEIIKELGRITPFDPQHAAGEIALVEVFHRRRPNLAQVVCFDTTFHRDMPRVARLLALPRRLEAKGVRRYGFHGLSYAYLMEELGRLGDSAARNGRIVLAHLGNGASIAAVRDGVSVDTSMGFTPASGLPMSTRAGDLDPGLVAFLARAENLDAEGFNTMVNFQSGLLGVSETSSDMRDLLALEAEDPRAAEAVALFCYQVKKWIGAYAAVLGGLDTLVFAGGIGENVPLLRARVCDGLEFLGIKLDAGANQSGRGLISGPAGTVSVRVIRTDEERMIAKTVIRVLKL